jgi:hypothetical protein
LQNFIIVISTLYFLLNAGHEKGMLVEFVNKVEAIVTWGTRIDQKVNEATTSIAKMKAVKRLSVPLLLIL